MKLVRKIIQYYRQMGILTNKITSIQEAIGRIECRQTKDLDASQINQSEFKVYSQWGEDGIIQYLLRHIPITNKIFIEFGVENYTESNTRFLLVNNNWSGLVIDADQKNIDFIKKDTIYWGFNLKAECAFITKDNINELIRSNGLTGDIGILSIDIDGNDYWVWEAINCISPRIIICEYNSLFGPSVKVTVPYYSNFYRNDAHHTGIYYGASISALHQLAKQKGYALVGSNTAGNNIFFVRNDLLGSLKELRPEDAFIQSKFRETKNLKGELTFDDLNVRRKKINHLDVFCFERNKIVKVKDIELC